MPPASAAPRDGPTPGPLASEGSPRADLVATIAKRIEAYLSRRGACFLFELQQLVERARLSAAPSGKGADPRSDQLPNQPANQPPNQPPTEPAEGSSRSRGNRSDRSLVQPRVGGLGQGSGLDPDAFETALWDLVWAGRITNDTFAPLRSLGAPRSKSRVRSRRPGRFGTRGLTGGMAGGTAGRMAGGGLGQGLAGGRWSLVSDLAGPDAWLDDDADPGAAGREDAALDSGAAAASNASAATGAEATERLLTQARILLERYGVVSREAVAAEGLPGGFGPLYRVLKQMEEVGQVRRGYFVEGLSGAQFALPAAVDRLRAARLDEQPLDGFEETDVRILAATDPANPYGALLPWPEVAPAVASRSVQRPTQQAPQQASQQASQQALEQARQPAPKRIAGAWVILVAGKPIVYVAASGKQILTFPSVVSDEGNELELALAALPRVPAAGRKRLLIQHIDGLPALESPLREALLAAGFEADYDALVPARFSADTARGRGTGRDPNAISCAGPRG